MNQTKIISMLQKENDRLQKENTLLRKELEAIGSYKQEYENLLAEAKKHKEKYKKAIKEVDGILSDYKKALEKGLTKKHSPFRNHINNL